MIAPAITTIGGADKELSEPKDDVGSVYEKDDWGSDGGGNEDCWGDDADDAKSWCLYLWKDGRRGVG